MTNKKKPMSKAVMLRLNPGVLERLDKYVTANFGNHYARSITVERAIREFLDREEVKTK